MKWLGRYVDCMENVQVGSHNIYQFSNFERFTPWSPCVYIQYSWLQYSLILVNVHGYSVPSFLSISMVTVLPHSCQYPWLRVRSFLSISMVTCSLIFVNIHGCHVPSFLSISIVACSLILVDEHHEIWWVIFGETIDTKAFFMCLYHVYSESCQLLLISG